MEGRKREERLDVMKGLLIVLVVAGHFLLPLKDLGGGFVNGIFYWIYSFHMPAFVFLSGLFSSSVIKDGHYRFGRPLSLLWLYLCYKLIVFFPERLAYGPSGSLPDLLHESGAPWYLLALFFWYLLILPLSLYRTRGEKCFIMVFLLLFSLLFGYMDDAEGIKDLLSLDRVTAFLPFFFLAYFLGVQGLKELCPERGSLKEGLCILTGLSLSLFSALQARSLLSPYLQLFYGGWYRKLGFSGMPEPLRAFPWLLRLLWYPFSLSIAFSIFLLIPILQRRELLWGALRKIGERTLQIYILHRPIRDLLLAAGYPKLMSVCPKLLTVFMLFFSLLLSVLLSHSSLTVFFSRLQGFPELLLGLLPPRRAEKQRTEARKYRTKV